MKTYAIPEQPTLNSAHAIKPKAARFVRIKFMRETYKVFNQVMAKK
ncbi:MAG: hypothetical protein HWE13_06470 [Gammaproteobacteria bacterium]|nr:hypothetical protein [Gammaproteobacteria bacterium]